MQIKKNKLLAEYLNIDFEKLEFSQKLDWGNDWNNLMKVANKLRQDTKYNYPFDFTENELSFDIETLLQNCFYFVFEINKENKRKS